MPTPSGWSTPTRCSPGLIAQQELDDATAKDRASQAQVDAAKSALAAAKQQLEVAKADQQHYSALSDYARIIAPYDGVVTWRFSDTGALVQAGTSNTSGLPVVTVAQVDLLRLRIPVPEIDCRQSADRRFRRREGAGHRRAFHRQSRALHRCARSLDSHHAGGDRRSQSQLPPAARHVCRRGAGVRQPARCPHRSGQCHSARRRTT